jgi:hypothetical protein
MHKKCSQIEWDFPNLNTLLAASFTEAQQKRLQDKSKLYNKLYVTFNNHYIKEQIRDAIIKEGSLINEGHLGVLHPVETNTKSVIG